MSKQQLQNIPGNHACALGAVAAGCRFYAGYPITPSSEVAERMSAELPKVGGVFVQMEDEIASMGAVIGASMGGVKAMTATSGPGFSLKQENLGYASQAEIPCVIINVMRGGPSTGMPTRPAQGDIMQARWGTHGDHPVIVLTPDSVAEIYSETIRAFSLSERLRVPVVVLYDEVVGHLIETVDLQPASKNQLFERKWATGDREDYLPYRADDDLIPPFPRPGDGYRTHTTGLTHDENGFPTQAHERVEAVIGRLLQKLDRHKDVIESFESIDCEDADVIVTAVGISARAAKTAVKTARKNGIKAGLFRPITLWPFPEDAFRKVSQKAKSVIVPEMNAGQLALELERFAPGKVSALTRYDGEHIDPRQILARIEEVLK